MKILEKSNVSNETIANITDSYINKRMKSCKTNIIIYFIIIIIACILLLIKVSNTTSVNVIIFAIAFIALMLLYDSFKETLSLTKALKTEVKYIKESGKLITTKKSRKTEFYISNKKIRSAQNIDLKPLNPYINDEVTGYFIDSTLFLLIVKKLK